MGEKIEEYNSYFPTRIMDSLEDMPSIKIMHAIFRKCKISKRIEKILLKTEDVKGISRMSFHRGLKKLDVWIYVIKKDHFTYEITLRENYYTLFELNYLRGKYGKQ